MAYGEVECLDTRVSHASVREKLERRKTDLTQELRQITLALEGLDRNPGIAEVIEQISKVGYL